MKNENVIATANVRSVIVIIIFGFLLAFALIISFLSNNSAHSSMYYGIFGSSIYILIGAGFAYFLYENIFFIKKAGRFITYDGERINILFHGAVDIGEIDDAALIGGLIIKNIEIAVKHGRPIRVRSYLVNGRAEDTVDKIRAIVSEFRSTRDDPLN